MLLYISHKFNFTGVNQKRKAQFVTLFMGIINNYNSFSEEAQEFLEAVDRTSSTRLLKEAK